MSPAAKPATIVSFIRQVGGPCPFCRGSYQAGYAVKQSGERVPTATLTWPMCAKYLELDVVDYVSEVRQALELQRN